MLGLVEADFGAAGQRDLGDGAPALFVRGGALDTFFCEGGHFGLQVVAHEVELVGGAAFGGVDCHFGWREGEDEPAVACVYGFEAEGVAEKCAVGFRVFAIENYVSPEIMCSQSKSKKLPRLRRSKFRGAEDGFVVDEVAVAHVEDAVAYGGCFGVVGDHEHGLL